MPMMSKNDGQQKLASSFVIVLFSVIPLFVSYVLPFFLVFSLVLQPGPAMQRAMLSMHSVSNKTE